MPLLLVVSFLFQQRLKAPLLVVGLPLSPCLGRSFTKVLVIATPAIRAPANQGPDPHLLTAAFFFLQNGMQYIPACQTRSPSE